MNYATLQVTENY